MPLVFKVPFSAPLSNAPLQPGKLIVIKGFVSVSPESFTVELVCGQDKDNDDIAAMFEFILKKGDTHNLAICRSRNKNEWFEPEITKGKFPFAAGQTFEMKIYQLEDGLRIYVDDKKFFDFPRQTDTKRISYIYIGGSLELNSVKFL